MLKLSRRSSRRAHQTRALLDQLESRVLLTGAFPGAYGFGANATGGRTGTVYHVTNLNDTGAGSFRDAVSASNRIVVFDVGGYINLASAVSVKSNLTIEGDTAPGDGIGLMGREVSFSNSSNDIVRYVRFRQGTLDPDSSKSGVNFNNSSNMIFDHVSIEFAQYDNIDAVGATNITFQNSIIADPIGQQFSAHAETVGGNFTWYNDIFANAHNRSPLDKINSQMINCVVYNYQAGLTAANTSGVFSWDVIDNYFIAGPSTTSTGNDYYQVPSNISAYARGNVLDGNKDGSLNGSAANTVGSATVLSAAWSSTTASMPTTSASAAYTYDIANAGDSLHRDGVDANVIANITSLGTSGSLWTSQSATGLPNSGYGTLNGGTHPTDTDNDGIPDSWESTHHLSNSTADSMNVNSATGYTYLELYANAIAAGPQPIANGTHTITSLKSNLLLDDPGSSHTSGTQITQNTANGGNDEKWTFTYNGSGYYTIVNVASGMALTSPSSTPGVALEQTTLSGADNQLWSIEAFGTGYIIRNKSTGLVIDDTANSTTPGAGMDCYTCNTNSNQLWLIQ